MARRHGPSSDAEAGQMMLMAAIVLLIGFIALAGMVARLGQLGQQTAKEQQRPLVLEVSPMKGGLDAAILRLNATTGFRLMEDTAANKTRYETAVVDILEHLRALEASRGFLLEYSVKPVAGCVGTDPRGYAQASLTDGELWVQVRSVTFRRASC